MRTGRDLDRWDFVFTVVLVTTILAITLVAALLLPPDGVQNQLATYVAGGVGALLSVPFVMGWFWMRRGPH